MGEGMNRTGISGSSSAEEMVKGARQLTRASGSADELAQNRMSYLRESHGTGSIPLPVTMKGKEKAAAEMLKGKDSRLLMDKLGERLAFERSGVRLYEALISKHQAEDPAFPLAELERIRDEELRHFHLLEETIERLGGDPSAMTPAANRVGIASMGLQKVLTDPGIGFVDSLEAILVAELADNDAWSLLILLTEEAGLEEVAASFQEALEKEEEHLEIVRSWLEKACLDSGSSERREIA
jgi:rubrerythrin